MNIYIHTLNGEPAVFSDGMICFAGNSSPNYPATSLRQIRREQQASILLDTATAGTHPHWEYDYMRYKVAPPEDQPPRTQKDWADSRDCY